MVAVTMVSFASNTKDNTKGTTVVTTTPSMSSFASMTPAKPWACITQIGPNTPVVHYFDTGDQAERYGRGWCNENAGCLICRWTLYFWYDLFGAGMWVQAMTEVCNSSEQPPQVPSGVPDGDVPDGAFPLILK